MFAYCLNNPISQVDQNGNFAIQNRLYCDGLGYYSKGTQSVKNGSSNVFGAGSSTSVTITKTEVQYLSDPLPITAKTGTKTTKTISKHGDSSRPISVYAIHDAINPIKSSSCGLKFNISNFTLNISLGLDNIGISGSLMNNNTTNSFGLKINLSELKIGFESSSVVQWDSITETTYTNVSANGWLLVVAYMFATTGQLMPSPSYVYEY